MRIDVRRSENRRRRCETQRAKRLSSGDRFDRLNWREIAYVVEHWRILHCKPIKVKKEPNLHTTTTKIFAKKTKNP